MSVGVQCVCVCVCLVPVENALEDSLPTYEARTAWSVWKKGEKYRLNVIALSERRHKKTRLVTFCGHNSMRTVIVVPLEALQKSILNVNASKRHLMKDRIGISPTVLLIVLPSSDFPPSKPTPDNLFCKWTLLPRCQCASYYIAAPKKGLHQIPCLVFACCLVKELPFVPCCAAL